jgi:hypothetical protein
MPLRTLFTVPDSYSVRQLPSVRRFSSCLKWQAPSGTCMHSPELSSTCMRSLEQPLLSNMFRLQMWLQFPAGVHHDHAALCPSLTLPTDIAMHRVVIIPRRPHRLSVSCATTEVLSVGPCPRSRHEPSPRVNALHSTQQTENAKATNPACDDGL